MDDAIADTLGELSHLFRTELRQASVGNDARVTAFQGQILTYIGRNPGLSVLALADLSGRDKAQVTRMLVELEALNLIRRERSTCDRRSMLLNLTDAGEELARQALARRQTLATGMLEPLTKDERAALHDMLDKMRDALKTRERDTDNRC